MQKGLIIKNVTNTYYIKSENEVYECVARGRFKQEDITPFVGDFVEFEIIDSDNKKGVIERILDRKNIINRPKVANISKMIFVISSKLPKPDLLMLDKQLAVAEYMNIEPIIVINKIDLDKKVSDFIKNEYSRIGYNVVLTNAITGEGIDELLNNLKKNNNDEEIIVLAGNSGVGKSSIINSILNKEVTKSGEISVKNKKGKNTTTIISLYEIDKNTYIVDTPGFSTFDINDIESIELDKYFIEFRNEIPKCEFQGCSHIKEQNCGVKKAVEDGLISNERYERYKKIYEDLKYREDHKY